MNLRRELIVFWIPFYFLQQHVWMLAIFTIRTQCTKRNMVHPSTSIVTLLSLSPWAEGLIKYIPLINLSWLQWITCQKFTTGVREREREREREQLTRKKRKKFFFTQRPPILDRMNNPKTICPRLCWWLIVHDSHSICDGDEWKSVTFTDHLWLSLSLLFILSLGDYKSIYLNQMYHLFYYVLSLALV